MDVTFRLQIRPNFNTDECENRWNVSDSRLVPLLFKEGVLACRIEGSRHLDGPVVFRYRIVVALATKCLRLSSFAGLSPSSTVTGLGVVTAWGK